MHIMKRFRINIIGRGNVATHLYKALKGKADCVIVNPHTLEELDNDADFSLISVSDSAISSVLQSLPQLKGIVAHTSGSTDISVFKQTEWEGASALHKCGVFYPLQTFSKEKEIIYSEIPLFIEAYTSECEKKLIDLGNLISDKTYPCDSTKRKHLHIASVFSCNFVNHLWALSYDYLQQNGLDFDMLLPLIRETVKKSQTGDPAECQTGPAVRGDMKIINSHLDALTGYPEMKRIYQILSESIMELKNKANKNK